MIFMVLLFFKKIWAFWVKIQKARFLSSSFQLFFVAYVAPQGHLVRQGSRTESVPLSCPLLHKGITH